MCTYVFCPFNVPTSERHSEHFHPVTLISVHFLHHNSHWKQQEITIAISIRAIIRFNTFPASSSLFSLNNISFGIQKHFLFLLHTAENATKQAKPNYVDYECVWSVFQSSTPKQSFLNGHLQHLNWWYSEWLMRLKLVSLKMYGWEKLKRPVYLIGLITLSEPTTDIM